ncbi:MAG: hypothetical protein N2253_04045 [Bacteroidia bacterium]|nr:hypothetical protein [Bacteroidia bacterium]MCX7764053.1 hypothetical protein [Bacteroidia bacterium]MDW8057082.1 hypothetical protein [Bacteroidia bacterium]
MPLLSTEKGCCLKCLLELPTTRFWLAPQNNEGFLRLAPHLPNLRGAVAGFWYTVGSPLRRWVQAAKYEGKPQLLAAAARYMATLIETEGRLPLSEIQAILPIPISPARQRQRGYNQVEWVARGMAEIWEIPILADHWVRRSGKASQLTRTRAARWSELEGEFQCIKPIPSIVAVVDDVLTTGATLVSALKSLPPSVVVWVFTVGITQRRR